MLQYLCRCRDDSTIPDATVSVSVQRRPPNDNDKKVSTEQNAKQQHSHKQLNSDVVMEKEIWEQQ